VLELVAEDPRDLAQALLAADRAGAIGGLTVKTCCSEQVRAGVAHLGDTDPTGVDVCEQRTALQRVVDHLPLGAHPVRVRGAPPVFAENASRHPTDR
jgi:hypothetical protein